MTLSLNDHLARRGLLSLSTNSLCEMFGITRQRVYQMKAASRDRDIPKKHLQILDDANAAADRIAEFQATAYCTLGAVSDADIEQRYGAIISACEQAFKVMRLDDEAGEAITGVLAKGLEDRLSIRARHHARARSVAKYDWYMRAYETGLGVPPLPRIGSRSGAGFYDLYNIAIERAVQRIKGLGGNPVVGFYPALSADYWQEHDARLWGFDAEEDEIDALRWFDADKENEKTWRWEFEPALVGNVLNDRLCRD